MPRYTHARVKNKHDTEKNWDKLPNFVPFDGEIIIYDIDETHTYPRLKVGDGKSTLKQLPFASDMANMISDSAKADTVRATSGTTIVCADDCSGTPIRNLILYGHTAMRYGSLQSVDLSNYKLCIEGRNKLPYPYISNGDTVNGVTFRDLGNGSILVCGTASEITYFNLFTDTVNRFLEKDGTVNALTSAQYVPYSKVTVKGLVLQQVGNEARFYIPIAKNAYTNKVFYPSIEQGDTTASKLPWQPYTTPMWLSLPTDIKLHGVLNNTQYNWCTNSGKCYLGDELNVITGELTDRVYHLQFDGSEDENWHATAEWDTRYPNLFAISLGKLAYSADGFVCNNYEYLPINSNKEKNCAYISSSRGTFDCFAINDMECSSVDDLREKLAANPVDLYFILETPEVTRLWDTSDLPVLHTFKPSTVVFGTTSTYIKMEYYSHTTAVPMLHSKYDVGKMLSIDEHGCVVLSEVGNAGKSINNGGEIFNDYRSNKAIAPYSHAEGNNTLAGCNGYRILSITANNDIYSVIVADKDLDVKARDIYKPGDIVNLDIKFHYYGRFEVGGCTECDDGNTLIDIFVDPELDHEWAPPNIDLELDDNNEVSTDPYDNIIWTEKYLEAGNEYIFSSSAHSSGDGTIAIGRSAHAEGRDTKAIGNYSHAEGRGSIANYASHAEGTYNEATGNNSHAEGAYTKAFGDTSHAEGRNSQALGTGSHAEGQNTVSIGLYSHAEGTGTESYGNNSHAEGYGCCSYGIRSHAEGTCTYALGNSQHVQGRFNIVDTEEKYAHIVGNGSDYDNYSNAHTLDWYGNAWFAGDVEDGEGRTLKSVANSVVGRKQEKGGEYFNVGEPFYDSNGNLIENIASGNYSHAEGYNTKAQGSYSHAEGRDATATGESAHAEGTGTAAKMANAHAEGSGTTANGYHSHAEGFGTTTEGTGSHAEGYGTYAKGQGAHAEGTGTVKALNSGAHAEGTNTEATGMYSHAQNTACIAKGDHSHAEGYHTDALGHSQHVQGRYNIKDTELDPTDSTGKRVGKYAHIVGNGGSEGTRSNAYALDWYGNAYFAGSVYVGSGVAGTAAKRLPMTYSGTGTPDPNLGVDGDIYIQYIENN